MAVAAQGRNARMDASGTSAQGGRIGAPPLPHEHGAWVMLLLPTLVGFAVARPAGWTQVTLLLLAITAAFLARPPVDMLLRGKGNTGSAFWATVYALAAVGAAIPLLVVWHAVALLGVACIAGVLFGIHVVLMTWPDNRRRDRSLVGEVLAVAGLTLGAPAAVVVGRGTITPEAWILWGAFSAFFAGSVFHVKSLLAGARYKGDMDWRSRWRFCRTSVLYHLALPVAALVTGARLGLPPFVLLIAVAPASVRALWSVWGLQCRLPPLKRVGALETVWSLWFAAWLGIGLLSR